MLHFFYKTIRIIIGLIFLYSGVSKLMSPVHFSVLINAYGIIPESTTLPAAYVLSILEIIAGAGIIFDLKGSLSVISGLLLLFMMVLGYGIYMGLDIDCGCFGPADPEYKAFSGLRSALFKDAVMASGIFFLYAARYAASIKTVSVGQFVNHIIYKGDFKNAV